MAQFAPFADAVKKKFDEMSKGELFIAGNARDVWACYLASFPEGTNSHFRERAEYDCECCKNFIRGIGHTVSIDASGNRTSVWDLKGLEYPFDVVAAKVAEFVAKQPIEELYRVAESKYGAKSNLEYLVDENKKPTGKTRQWDHFYGNIAKAHLTDQVGTLRGEYRTYVQVFKRGLEELNPSAIVDVLELIADKNLYRGDEFKDITIKFQKLQNKYLQLTTNEEKNVFLWQNAEPRGGSQFRSCLMGDLIIDLSGTPASVERDGTPVAAKEPRDFESAVLSYESKADPNNYKRSKSLVTPRQKEDTLKFIAEQGWEDSLQRRLATLADISVNNVRWVDATVQGKMKNPLADLLMAAPAKVAKVDESKSEDISIDDFMTKILPQVQTMEMFVRNHQINNFMTLTTAVYADAKPMFKWNNDFAWSYNGNITDSALRQRVQSAGGRVDGVLRFSHTWNYDKRNASLMDLHVFMPGCGAHEDGCHDQYPSLAHRVGWQARNHRESGGKQDVDYTSEAPVGYVPVENITFPDLGRLKNGKYVFKIHNWQLRQPTQGGVKAEIEFGGQIFQYEIARPMKQKEWITLAEATLKNGEFTIEHKWAVGAASQDVWGVQTEKFVKVSTLLNSPNYWDDNATGNKHYFFILEGCKTDEAARGIYNEFLNDDFQKHRKVFEILGDLTKCAPADEQLSGLGFSSTRGDTVIVKVTGNKLYKTYNVKF